MEQNGAVKKEDEESKKEDFLDRHFSVLLILIHFVVFLAVIAALFGGNPTVRGIGAIITLCFLFLIFILSPWGKAVTAAFLFSGGIGTFFIGLDEGHPFIGTAVALVCLCLAMLLADRLED